MNEVMKYIEEHLTDDLQLIDIAQLFGYSPWHLNVLFKEHTSDTIIMYIRKRRIYRAAVEMTKGRRLFDIALDYGFETQAGFYKAFNAIMGCPPSQYKGHELRGICHRNTEMIQNIYVGDDFMESVVVCVVRHNDVKDLWENIFSRNTPAEVEARIAESLQGIAAGEHIQYVAEVDGIVIGSMSVQREKHPLSRHKCALVDVVVNPAFWRMGIARKLFHECVKETQRAGLKLMTVNTRGGTVAEEVYKKLGFIEAGRIPNGIVEPWGDQNTYDDVLYYLPL